MIDKQTSRAEEGNPGKVPPTDCLTEISSCYLIILTVVNIVSIG